MRRCTFQQLEQREEGFYGGAMWWSPRKIGCHNARKARLAQEEAEVKQQKRDDKEQRAAARLAKAKLVEQRRVDIAAAKVATVHVHPTPGVTQCRTVGCRYCA